MHSFDVFDRHGKLVRTESSLDKAHAREKADGWARQIGGSVAPHDPSVLAGAAQVAAAAAEATSPAQAAPFPGTHWHIEINLPNGTVSQHNLWGDKTHTEAGAFAQSKATLLGGTIKSIEQVAGGLGPKYSGPPVRVLGGEVR